MGLINKMLKDLEKREAYLAQDQDVILDGLYSAYDLELNKKEQNTLFYKILLFLILLISIVCFIVFYDYNSRHIDSYQLVDVEEVKTENQMPDTSRKIIEQASVVETQNKSIQSVLSSETNNMGSVIETDVAVIKNQSKENNFNKSILLKLDQDLVIEYEEQTEDQTNNTPVNRVESVHFQKNNAGIDLIMEMPRDIDYLVYGLSNPPRTVIEIENAELGFPIEALEPTDPVVAIRYSINENKRLKLVFEADQPLSIRKSSTSQSNNMHNLVVSIDYDWREIEADTVDDSVFDELVENNTTIEKVKVPTNPTVYKGELIKTPANKQTSAYAEKLFQEAYALYLNQNISDSLKMLNMALDQDASHVNARSTLALILSEQGHNELAYSVLNEGLIQYPDVIEWLKMVARLKLAEDKPVEAARVLSEHSPPISSHTEFYAMQAAIFQKLNDHTSSARIYRDLLQINPLKAIWWMGLGISLESLKRYDDALYAYQKALNNPSLAGESKQFVSQRLVMLNNLIKDESS
jgi:Tfp pilus assembly protein PilF